MFISTNKIRVICRRIWSSRRGSRHCSWSNWLCRAQSQAWKYFQNAQRIKKVPQSQKSCDKQIIKLYQMADRSTNQPFHQMSNNWKTMIDTSTEWPTWSACQVMMSLLKHGLYKDSIVLFTTDNGGGPWYSNRSKVQRFLFSILFISTTLEHIWFSPLRGAKESLYEGGVRGVAFLITPGGRRGTYRFENFQKILRLDASECIWILKGIDPPGWLDAHLHGCCRQG